MASKTEIANRALSKLGQPRVSNIETTNIKAARVIDEMWDSVRDAMLRSYRWNFAIKRTSLAKDATAPVFGFDNRYLLPSDYLKLIQINEDPDYSLEGGYIHTDEGSPLKIRYVRRVTNPGEFDPLFSEALASKLAYEAAEEITQSNTKKDLALRDFQITVSEAFASDSIENLPEALEESDWLLERF